MKEQVIRCSGEIPILQHRIMILPGLDWRSLERSLRNIGAQDGPGYGRESARHHTVDLRPERWDEDMRTELVVIFLYLVMVGRKGLISRGASV